MPLFPPAGGGGGTVDQVARDAATGAAAAAANAATQATYAMLGHKSTLSEGFDMSGATDMTAKLQATLNGMQPGSVFWLTSNPASASGSSKNTVIKVTAPIIVPQGITVCGPNGAASVWGYAGGFPVAVSVDAAFTGSSVFKMDAGTGQINDFTFRNVSILGNHAGTNVDGWEAIGTTVGLTLDHCDVRGMSGNGVSVESNTTGTPKGFRFDQVMSESNDGWSFYFDGLTDSDVHNCQAHTSTLGGWYLAGLGDSRLTSLRATFVGGPGYQTADCSRAGRPWGAGVQIDDIGTDRSSGPGFYHTAHNLNPITIGLATFGRDQSLGGGATTPVDTNAAVKVDGGGSSAGVLAFGTLSTMVGYDDTGQDDTFSSPGYALDLANSRGVTIGAGSLWGKLGQIKPMTDTVSNTVGPINIGPATWLATGTRANLAYVGPRGNQLNLRVASPTSTTGVQTAGDRTLTVPQGHDFVVGMIVRAESAADPTIYVEGPLSFAAGTTIKITPTTRAGSGQPNGWNVYASVLRSTSSTSTNTTTYVGTPTVTYSGTAWPSRSSIAANYPGYTGLFYFDSTPYPTAPAPTDMNNAAGDIWLSSMTVVTLTGSTAGQVSYITGANALAGAASALIENGYFRVTNAQPGTKPASNGVDLTGTSIGNRQVGATYDPQGRMSPLQTDLAVRSTALIAANGSGGVSVFGTTTASLPATGANGTMSSTNVCTASKRTLYEAATATTAIAGIYEQAAKILPSTSLFGGAQVTFRLAFTKGTASTTRRIFVGLSSSIAAISDVDPSSLANIVGFGCDAADANLSFMWKGATGTATKVSTGIAKTSIADGTEVYEITLTQEPNSYYWAGVIKTLSTGALSFFDTSSGGTTPDQNTPLAARAYMSAGGTTTPVGIALLSYKQEADN